MTVATTEGYYGPDPEDSREDDEFLAICRRIDEHTITEPFAEEFTGELTPLDKKMRHWLGVQADRGFFDEPNEWKDKTG